MNHELNLLRLKKIKEERNEIIFLKSKYKIYDINRFSINKEKQDTYQRNISIIRKLVKILPYNNYIPFHIHINNTKKLRILNSKHRILLNHICDKFKIPIEIINLIVNLI